MVSYLHGRSAREYFDLGTDPRVLLKLIWESINGPSEVALGVDDLKSTWKLNWSPFGVYFGYILVHLGSILGSILGPC